MQIYRTVGEENVYDVARKYGVSPVKIAENNEITTRGPLPSGRELLILTPSRTYNVRSTDTLGHIADRFKTTKEALLRLNPELGGRDKLYSGQLLTVSECTPSYGMISTNGYLYAGTSKDRLIAMLPFLGYVTVCSAVYKDGRINSLYPSDEMVNIIRSNGRAPIIRIYLTELPGEDMESDFANSLRIMAASGGFTGVTLSSLNTMSKDKERLCRLVLTVRRALMESDILLFTEGDAECECAYMDYADAGILTYDKIHKQNAPSFQDGERATLEKYAYSLESSRTFVEIPSFAYLGGRYIEKREGLRLIDKKRARLEYDGEKKLLCSELGRHRKRECVLESLENTKAKLELVSELGFIGISFDIGRVCTPDLMIAASMFDVISHPIMSVGQR